jgi:hypothetical protein
MKNLKILGGIVLCILSLHAGAQLRPPLNELPAMKPLLFTDLPSTFNISQLTIEKIFAGPATGNIKLAIDNGRTIEGVIVEKLQRSAAVTTVNIKLPQYQQALLTISRITGTDKRLAYTGRVVHINYGDVLILKQEAEKLYFKKEKQSLFLVE